MMAYSENTYDPDTHKSVWVGVDYDDTGHVLVETDGAVKLDRAGAKKLRNSLDKALRRMDP